MSRGQPAVPRPTGFTLLGLYLGWNALGGYLLALNVSLGPRALDDALDRGALLVAVLAAVAAESIWRCRPWCVRATALYLGATLVGPLVAVVNGGPVEAGEAVVELILQMIIALVVGFYVRQRALQLFGPRAGAPAIRIPVPRP